MPRCIELPSPFSAFYSDAIETLASICRFLTIVSHFGDNSRVTLARVL